MKNQTLTPQEVRLRGLDALSRELGVVGALKFMHQYEKGAGDYTKERNKFLNGFNLDKIKTALDKQ